MDNSSSDQIEEVHDRTTAFGGIDEVLASAGMWATCGSVGWLSAECICVRRSLTA